VTDYFLTNNISGAWIGSWFANEEKWNALPEHLKQLYISCMEATHTFRNQWYWGGEAKLRATGDKLQLRSVPASEWKQVEDAAKVFWDEIAAESETKAKVISIFKEYNERHQQRRLPLRRKLTARAFEIAASRLVRGAVCRYSAPKPAIAPVVRCHFRNPP
jgi:TRAP-type mannitol/chloroaromatic compound transport system substrate-binding protein